MRNEFRAEKIGSIIIYECKKNLNFIFSQYTNNNTFKEDHRTPNTKLAKAKLTRFMLLVGLHKRPLVLT